MSDRISNITCAIAHISQEIITKGRALAGEQSHPGFNGPDESEQVIRDLKTDISRLRQVRETLEEIETGMFDVPTEPQTQAH